MARTIVQTEAMNFLGIEQLRSKERNTGSELQTGGLYRVVRHPMYFTSIIVIWTTPIMTLNTATLFACMTIYFYLGSIHEEKLLVIQFGEKYVSYKKKVPRILPGPRSFTSR
jgi:protein-S-isoprenylcysteine O-methyltransferase Ste14